MISELKACNSPINNSNGININSLDASNSEREEEMERERTIRKLLNIPLDVMLPLIRRASIKIDS